MIRRSRILCHSMRRARLGPAAIALGLLLQFSLPSVVCYAAEDTETDTPTDPATAPSASDLKATSTLRFVASGRDDSKPVASMLKFGNASAPRPDRGSAHAGDPLAVPSSKSSRSSKLGNLNTWHTFDQTISPGFVGRADGSSIRIVRRLPVPPSPTASIRLASHSEPIQG